MQTIQNFIFQMLKSLFDPNTILCEFFASRVVLRHRQSTHHSTDTHKHNSLIQLDQGEHFGSWSFSHFVYYYYCWFERILGWLTPKPNRRKFSELKILASYRHSIEYRNNIVICALQVLRILHCYELCAISRTDADDFRFCVHWIVTFSGN